MKINVYFFWILIFILILILNPCYSQDTKNKNTVKKISALQKINQLKKTYQSVPELIKILKEKQTEAVALTTLQFLNEMKAENFELVKATISLLKALDAKLKVKIQAELTKAKYENFFIKIREIFNTSNNINEKDKVASLLKFRGSQEINTFLTLFQSENKQNREIATKYAVYPQYSAKMVKRLAELLELDIDAVLKENILEVWKKIGENDLSTLLFGIKGSPDIGYKYLSKALLKIGDKIVDPSIEMLRINSDVKLQVALQEFFLGLGPHVINKLIPLTDDLTPKIRNFAKETIQKFDIKAVVALNKILQETKKEEKLISVLKLLKTFKEKTAPALDTIKPFLTKQGQLQYQSLLVVQSMGIDAQKVVPQLIVAFKSKDWLIRAAAANALANTGKAAIPALSLFRKRLRINQYGEPIEYFPEVRTAICRAIGNIGPKAKSAVPELINCLQDFNEVVVKESAKALLKMKQIPYKAIAPLIEVLKYNTNAQDAAARALSITGKRTISKMISMIRYDDNATARLGAALTLKYMGAKARPAINALVSVLRMDPVPIIRKEAAIALGKIGPISSSSIKGLIDACNDDSPEVRNAVAQALAEMGKSILYRVLSGLRTSREPKARITLLRAIGNLKNDARSALPTLVRYLRYWRGEPQKEIIKTINKIGKPDNSVLPIMIDILKTSNDKEMHQLVREFLAKFGKKYVRDLIDLLKSPQELTRESAIILLEKFSKEAKPYLLDILKKKEDYDLIAQVIKIFAQKQGNLYELIKLLDISAPVVQKNLSNAFLKMHLAAIPELVKVIALGQNDIAIENAGNILGYIGVASIPQVLSALKTAKRGVSKKTYIKTIGSMGTKARIAIKPLIEFLIKWKGDERKTVAKSLGNIGVAAVPSLVELLHNKDKDIQRTAIFALGETKSPKAIEYLLNSLDNTNLLSIIIEAMVKMQKLATPVLIRFLGHENDYIRFGCVAALSEIKSKKAIPKLKEQEEKEKHPMIKYLIKVAIRNSQR